MDQITHNFILKVRCELYSYQNMKFSYGVQMSTSWIEGAENPTWVSS